MNRCLFVCLWVAALFSIPSRGAVLAAGTFLVASRDLLDPNFARTVVLLVHSDEDGVLGLVVNRRTKVPLSRVFEDLRDAGGQSEPIYAGGPVAPTVALALLRAREKPEDAEHVFADVHLISSGNLLESTMAAGTESSSFHVYAGYSGWTVDQLQNEVNLGAWHILPADAASVFDPNPETLWSRLIRRTEQQIAGLNNRG